jgi:transporter family-2 protein
VKGIVFAIMAGAFITFQGVANTRISQDIGTWQTATVTQFTGFLGALLILLIVRDPQWRSIRQVKPLYLMGGAFAAVIIASNITSIKAIGVTLTTSAVLIAQLTAVFLTDSNGWFGVIKQKMGLSHLLGIALMITGVAILGLG